VAPAPKGRLRRRMRNLAPAVTFGAIQIDSFDAITE
jgi:hypothetical protein